MSNPTPQPDFVELRRQMGHKYTYWHGTSLDALDSILKEGLKPGSDGRIYVSLRQDFAEKYSRGLLLQVRLPYELERNPWSPTTNAECMATDTIAPEFISVHISAVLLTTHTEKAVSAARIDENEQNLSIFTRHVGCDGDEQYYWFGRHIQQRNTNLRAELQATIPKGGEDE